MATPAWGNILNNMRPWQLQVARNRNPWQGMTQPRNALMNRQMSPVVLNALMALQKRQFGQNPIQAAWKGMFSTPGINRILGR